MLENVILGNLLENEKYTRKVIPFLRNEYFDHREYQVAFEEISKFFNKYNTLPTKQAIQISLDEREDLTQDQYDKTSQIVDGLETSETTSLDWLLDTTEKFCQDKAIYNAVRDSIRVLDGEDNKLDRGAIPQLLADALGVGFDTKIGHDYINDFEERFQFYHTLEDKIEFDLEYLNKITKGGVSRKSLMIVMGGTGTGKTLFLCHCAAANLLAGYNVLYITLEMSEKRIAERIDSNMLDVEVDELKALTKEEYTAKFSSFKKQTTGRLKVKEYPTASASTNHFRFLINELKLKDNFVPDIIYIDYMNICSSARMKLGNGQGSYGYIKAIAEELRGLAIEFNVPVVTATQANRQSHSDTDVGLEGVSESFGGPMTADLFMSLINSEELQTMGQIMVKQLKNRWGDITSPSKFVLGIDRRKMRLFDVEQEAQDLSNEPVMDRTDFGRKDKPSFDGFK